MLRNFLDIFHYRELIKTLVGRDLKVRYKKSILGYAWTWLEPLLTMFTFILVFDVILKIKTPNFPVYLLTGLIPWIFFNNCVGQAVHSISGNAGLIKRVYYPREIFPLTLTLGNGVNLFLGLLIMIPVSLAFGIHITPKILLLPIPIVFLLFFAYGMGLLFACLNVFLRDMAYIAPFILRLWFYLTPIFYVVEGRVPERYFDLYMFVNPMAVILGLFRTMIMSLKLPSVLHIVVAFATCTAMLICGYIFFKRNEDRMVKMI
jgi:homopolymeric O-antigen transport system permease protein